MPQFVSENDFNIVSRATTTFSGVWHVGAVVNAVASQQEGLDHLDTCVLC